ncbi:MAG: choice-of-anchor D domain-containing protein [Myxococcaceae bacterium]
MRRLALASVLVVFAAACGGDRVGQVRPQLVPPVDTQDFGAVPVLNKVALDIPVQNVGRGLLTVSNVAILEDGTPFTIVSAPSEVASSDTANINVSFTPPKEQDYSATLQLTTDDGDNPVVTVKLVGKGSTRAIMEVDPVAIDFGRVAEGTAAVKTFTIRSKGTADLIVEDLAFTDGTSPAFSFVGSSKTPATVKAVGANGLPGQIQLTLKYTVPEGAPDTATGGIRIRGTDPDNREVTISLNGLVNRAPIPRIAPLGNGAPGMQVQLDGTGSTDPDNDLPLTYHWTLRQKPLGANTTLSTPDQSTSSMTLDPAVPGQYEVQLEVTDAAGAKNLTPARATIVASPAQKLLIEMFWDNSDTDLDLHVTRVNSAELYSVDDCYYGNTAPDWGVAADTSDDPEYLRDALTGYGPEVMGYVNPIDTTYRLHVVFANSHLSAMPLSNATVRVYEFGVLKGEFKRAMAAQGDRWDVADVEWPSGNITALP